MQQKSKTERIFSKRTHWEEYFYKNKNPISNPSVFDEISKSVGSIKSLNVKDSYIEEVSQSLKINKKLKFLKNKSHLNYDDNSTKETINGIIFEYKIYDDLIVKELKPNAENFIKNNESQIV